MTTGSRTGSVRRSGWTAARTLLGILPPLLALVAEGAWVATAYALVQAASDESVLLGPIELALVAAVGSLAARGGALRLGSRWPAVAVGCAVVAGLAGWAWSPATRDLLLSDGLPAAIRSHPGGWLAGLAFVRGLAHGGRHQDAGRLGSLLPIGVAVACTSFLLGGALAEPGRAVFVGAAMTDVVVFVACALVALALARIRELGGSGGFDWRRNPAWLGLLVTLVAGILLVAVPASFALGPLVILVVALLPVPLFFAGLLTGVDRRGWRTLVGVTAVALLVIVLVRMFAGPNASSEGAGGGPGGSTVPPEQAWMTVAAWTFFLVGIAIVVALLAAVWMRQALSRGDEDVAEERSIDYGQGAPGRTPRRFRFERRSATAGPPTDAVQAYLATLRELASIEAWRRRARETPAEHARRLRASGEPPFGPAVDLLAADYELARFGSRKLTAAEERRAVGRWRRVRTGHRP
jgi:hypothetical protein